MAASRVGAIVAAAFTSTTNNATLAGTTNAAVAAGDTAFGFIGVRGGTLGEVTSISGLPLDAVVELVVTTRAGSAGNSQCRMYLPSGMASGTVVTFNLDAAATRKVGWMEAWTQVANANNVATANANGTTGPSLNSGTTGAVPSPTSGGVHFVTFVGQSASALGGFTPGSDPEGALTETADAQVGATNFNRLGVMYGLFTVAQAGGDTATATVTSGTIASWTGLQVVWDGASSGITLNAPLATGAGTAFVPTGSMTADATPIGTGAGTGLVPSATLRGDAPEALGAGTGLVPSGSMTALAPEALGAGTAFAASLGGVTVSAPLALGAGVAFIPSGSMTATAPQGTGAGTALVPVGGMTGNAPEALGAGVAFPAGGNVSGPVLHRTLWRHPFRFSWSDKGGFQ